MSFLAPLFLAGAAAIAVPLLLHLTQRSRTDVERFPSIMFLSRVPFRSTRRRRIRHPWLLAARCLAILLLAAAFARPFLAGAASAGAREGEAREVVLLLDRSYSMRYGDRWERATSAARQVLAGLAPEDRVSLVPFAERAEAVVRSAAAPAEVEALLETLAPGFAITRYDPALRLAARLLADSELPQREIVLVSDFQRSGWPDRAPVPMPADVRLVPADIAEPDPLNLAVTDVLFRREAAAGRERITAAARVTNFGDRPVPDLEVSIALGGKVAATRRVELGPRESENVRFPGLAVPDATTRGEVRITPDLLPVDDRFHFVLSPDDALDALIVDANVRRDASLFVRRALAIGETPPIRMERKREPALRAADFTERDLVILNDVGDPGGTVGAALRSWVEAGGGLLVALGERNRAARWPETERPLLPGAVGEVRDRTGDGGAVLAALDFDHPALAVFAGARSGDFSGARFLRYRRFQPSPEARVVARFDDGSAALVEGRVGQGRVMVWASTLDRFWNDLPLQPVFLPLLHQLARSLAAYEETRRWHQVGQLLDVGELLGAPAAGQAGPAGEAVASGAGQPGGGAGEAEAEDWLVVAPSGVRTRVRLEAGAGLVELTEPGFHAVRRIESSGEGTPVAVNPALEESELTPLSAADFAAEALASGALPDPEAGEEEASFATDAAGRARTGHELWWFLMLGAALLLGTETLISNRLSRARRVTPGRPAGTA